MAAAKTVRRKPLCPFSELDERQQAFIRGIVTVWAERAIEEDRLPLSRDLAIVTMLAMLEGGAAYIKSHGLVNGELAFSVELVDPSALAVH